MSAVALYDPEILKVVEEITERDGQQVLELLEECGYAVIAKNSFVPVEEAMLQSAESVQPIMDTGFGMRNRLIEQGWDPESAEQMAMAWVNMMMDVTKVQILNSLLEASDG